MTDLFSNPLEQLPITTPLPGASVPLAERMRPKQLEDVVGQEHLTGPRGPIFQMVRTGRPQSMILHGKPGCGKTSLAQLLADVFDLRFRQLSAIHANTADFRAEYELARKNLMDGGRSTILLVDEIHRLTRPLADSLLPHIESGSIVLIGATTEHVGFALPSALISRATVYQLNALSPDHMDIVLRRAEEAYKPLNLQPEARKALIQGASGDARYLLGQAELLMDAEPVSPMSVEEVSHLLAARLAKHDADTHYNLASAFQKSVRASDPQAAILYAAKMVEAGEDPRFIFRRLIVYASEEVGMADPQALVVAISAQRAYELIGFPEAGYALTQAIVHIATAPKSNAGTLAWKRATELAKATRHIDPPNRILNAPTAVCAKWGRNEGYQYDHDHPGAFSGQDCWPDEIEPEALYVPNPRGFEAQIQKRLEHWDALRVKR